MRIEEDIGEELRARPRGRKPALRASRWFSRRSVWASRAQRGEVLREEALGYDRSVVVISIDPIGNRTSAVEGTTAKSYQANALNEYVSAGGAAHAHDADGNLVSDGVRRFVYDGENRLVGVEPLAADDGDVRVRMAYDYLGRRVQKVVEEWDGSSWALSDDVRFVYLGWNVIEERRTSASVSTRKNFVWGLDLSQTLDGAGGVGGLLAVVDNDGEQLAFAYNGNGDVGQLVDAQGGLAARYEYDAFGNVLRADGSVAQANAWRFSTKYGDQETGLVYYSARFNSPPFGRWISRDPAGEDEGGENLHEFALNDALNRFDVNGLVPTTIAEVIDQLRKAAEANGVTPERLSRWTHSLMTESPPFLALGNAAHRAVMDKYEQGHPTQRVMRDESMSEILATYGKQSPSGSSLLRPDILNRSSESLYEIKSVRGASVAIRALKDYLEVFRRAGVCTVKPGLERVDGAAVWPSGLRIDWYRADPGVVLYEITDLPGPAPVPLPAPGKVGRQLPIPAPILLLEALGAAALAL